jgi:hypothetical protein
MNLAFAAMAKRVTNSFFNPITLLSNLERLPEARTRETPRKMEQKMERFVLGW